MIEVNPTKEYDLRVDLPPIKKSMRMEVRAEYRGIYDEPRTPEPRDMINSNDLQHRSIQSESLSQQQRQFKPVT